MTKRLFKTSLYLFIFSFILIFAFSGCEKIAGHNTGKSATATATTTTGTSSSNGVGPIAVGGTNTIIFQINNGVTRTMTTSGYVFGLNNVYDPVFKTNSTTVSGFDLLFTNSVILTYYSILSGTYTLKFITIQLSDGTNIQQLASSENVKVISESISAGGVGNAATGTVTGTFDGYASNTVTTDSVRVSGSFNISK